MSLVEDQLDNYTEANHKALTNHSTSDGRRRTGWNLKASAYSIQTINPIRSIVEGLKIEPNPEKHLIPLSIGDPTTFGNFKVSDFVLEAVKESLYCVKSHGYGPSNGHLAARTAIAEYSAHQGDVKPDDVILCSGCSSSLDFCITALAQAGDNILCPKPGFSIYQTLAEGMNINVRYYDLVPERNWEANLTHMESLIDERTRAILVINPSNPCGSVYSKQHLLEVLEMAEKHYLPIIADEIYELMVFPGVKYHSISSLSKNVPVLTCSGLTKRFLVPGWRIGWIVIHDRNNVLKEVRRGLGNLGGRILSCNTIIQAALPKILKDTPQSFFDDTVKTLKKHADIAFEILKEIPGLKPMMPQGAMYMMVGIDIVNFPEYEDEMDFVQAMVREQSVFCLPGKCFEIKNFFRLVITVPSEQIRIACHRISEFCDKHYKFDHRMIENEIFEHANGFEVGI